MDEPRVSNVADPSHENASFPDSHNGHAPTPQNAIREGLAHLAEIREYLSFLVGVKIDSIKTFGRDILIYAVAGVLCLAAGAALVGTAAVLLLLGCAHGLGEAFHHVWIGEIIVAAIVLGGIAIGLLAGLKLLPRIMHKQLVAKYEARRRKQRSEFGRDISQRARAGRDRPAGHSN